MANSRIKYPLAGYSVIFTSICLQENVDVLLHKMACQHPYHVVPILFALKYGDLVPKNRQV